MPSGRFRYHGNTNASPSSVMPRRNFRRGQAAVVEALHRKDRLPDAGEHPFKHSLDVVVAVQCLLARLGANHRIASLARPGGNVTGIGFQNTELQAKALGLLRELVPQRDTKGRVGLLEEFCPHRRASSLLHPTCARRSPIARRTTPRPPLEASRGRASVRTLRP